MRKSDEVVLILTADWHLSDQPPVFRSAEPDWQAAEVRVLDQLNVLWDKHACPVAVAGDVFHHWKASPETINLALRGLPTIYAVPGNHDLPNHSYKQVHRSAYGTLVHAKKIRNLKPGECVELYKVRLWGFPHGYALAPIPKSAHQSGKKLLNVAVVHDYCWDTGKSFPGAPKTKHWSEHLRAARGCYDVLAFGDNHKGFIVQDESRRVVNCGGLMVRNSDEVGYKPFVTLVYADGRCEPHHLDTSADRYEDRMLKEAESYGIDEQTANRFMDAARKLGEEFVDFKAVLKQFVTSKGVRAAVADVLKQWTEG